LKSQQEQQQHPVEILAIALSHFCTQFIVVVVFVFLFNSFFVLVTSMHFVLVHQGNFQFQLEMYF